MEVHDYRCKACGKRFELIRQPAEKPAPVVCPQCHSHDVEPLERV